MEIAPPGNKIENFCMTNFIISSSKEFVRKIMASDELRIKETRVYAACKEWATRQIKENNNNNNSNSEFK